MAVCDFRLPGLATGLSTAWRPITKVLSCPLLTRSHPAFRAGTVWMPRAGGHRRAMYLA